VAGPLVYERKYHGETVWARERIAITQLGDVQLELVQPVEGPPFTGTGSKRTAKACTT